jgi:hypothetical protein
MIACRNNEEGAIRRPRETTREGEDLTLIHEHSIHKHFIVLISSPLNQRLFHILV